MAARYRCKSRRSRRHARRAGGAGPTSTYFARDQPLDLDRPFGLPNHAMPALWFVHA